MPAYPSFRHGVVVQFPYTKERNYLIQSTVMESGPQISNYLRSDSLPAWEWLQQLNDDEVVTFRTFIFEMAGRFGVFDFTPPPDTRGDPPVTYINCRLDMDEVEIRHVGPNMHTAKIRIVQVKP